jgi:hypothetical protein
MRRWWRAFRACLAVTCVAWTLYLSTYLRYFQPIFFLPAGIALACGAANLVHRLSRWRRLRPVVFAAVAVVVAWQVRAHFNWNDLSKELAYQERSLAFLSSLEPDAVVFSTWNYSTLFWFHQWVGGVNRSVEIVNALPSEWMDRAAAYTGRPQYFERVPPGMRPDDFARGFFHKLRTPTSP